MHIFIFYVPDFCINYEYILNKNCNKLLIVTRKIVFFCEEEISQDVGQSLLTFATPPAPSVFMTPKHTAVQEVGA